MNMKRMLAGAAAVVMLLSSCGDDEKMPQKKEQIMFSGEVVSLEDANLYLMNEVDFESGHRYRDYFITDGTGFTGGNYWNINNYTGATYLIGIEAGVPEEEEFRDGEFPQYDSFFDASETSKVSWINYENEDAYYATNDIIGGDPIELSGGFDNGDVMTVKFNGVLMEDTDEGWVEAEGQFYFEGRVQDMRQAVISGTNIKD